MNTFEIHCTTYKQAQMSAWLHIHLSTCSQIQSSHVWFDWTTEGLHDGWKMSLVPWPNHFCPFFCFQTLTLPFWLLSLRSTLLSDMHVTVSIPALLVPHPHAQPVSFTSHAHWNTLDSFCRAIKASPAMLFFSYICMGMVVVGGVIIANHYQCHLLFFLRLSFDAEWRYHLKPDIMC